MSSRHLVLIPSYNSGAKLIETVTDALIQFQPVWVVIDGSNDGSDKAIAEMSLGDARLRVLRRACNGGKGAAVFDGLREAAAEGFTHALVMDADGQHPAWMIPEFIEISSQRPQAMVLGVPIFDRSAPWLRVVWRRLSNVLARIETREAIGDSLFGFRVYPVAPLLEIMLAQKSMRRFDFDAEAAVRLSWHGVPVINRTAPVRYFCKHVGGTSHFRYGRDNALLAAMHLRLMAERLGWLAGGALRRFDQSIVRRKAGGPEMTRSAPDGL